jgi:molybdenum cofactor cytidylyltransferase
MISVVILAAGSSSRMGQPKQNLVFNSNTLLQRTINEARLVTEEILVILGSGIEEILPTIESLNVTIFFNKQWNLGMAKSINIAVEHLLSSKSEINGIIFLLCDQPYVNVNLLKQLITTAELSTKGIIACTYNGTVGVPVLFKKKYFRELLKLKGKEGAKKLLESFADDLHTIPFPLGYIDIDTETDFKKLISAEATNSIKRQ